MDRCPTPRQIHPKSDRLLDLPVRGNTAQPLRTTSSAYAVSILLIDR